MNAEQLYVYFKPDAAAAAAGLAPWLAHAQALREATPGLDLQCLTRLGVAGATWMETYAGLPLADLEAAQAQMALHTQTLGVQRHIEVFSRL